MSTQMKIIAAKQMGQEATKKASAGAGALTRFVRENNWSVRGLSFLGSLAMIILSILKLINFFGVLTDFFGYVINVYSLLFAYVMLMIEAKNEWPLVEVIKVCFLLRMFHVEVKRVDICQLRLSYQQFGSGSL